jgi:hypothetical protein
VLRADFTAFCHREWCVENIFFLQAVDEFATLAPGPAREAQARRIVDEFIRLGAPMQVNLEQRQLEPILQALKGAKGGEGEEEGERLPANLFHQAHHHILGMVQNDSFTRWQTTEAFREALQKVKDMSSSTSSASFPSMKQQQQQQHGQSRVHGGSPHALLQEPAGEDMAQVHIPLAQL